MIDSKYDVSLPECVSFLILDSIIIEVKFSIIIEVKFHLLK